MNASGKTTTLAPVAPACRIRRIALSTHAPGSNGTDPAWTTATFTVVAFAFELIVSSFGVVPVRLISDSVIFGYHAGLGVIRTFIDEGKFIRWGICLRRTRGELKAHVHHELLSEATILPRTCPSARRSSA